MDLPVPALIQKREEGSWLTDPPERLDRLTRGMTPRMRRRFLAIVERTRQSLPLGRMATMVQQGDTNGLTRILSRIASTFAAEVGSAYSSAGRNTSKFLSQSLNIVLDFDVTSDRAASFMRSSRLRMVREFSADQHELIANAIAEGVRDGTNPIETARRIRLNMGLTANQERTVERYRRMLQQGSSEALRLRLRDARFDSTVRSSMAEQRPLTATQIEKMVRRYRERMLSLRSEVIARTESHNAVGEASEEAYLQAIEDGSIDPDGYERFWNTAKDERVRSSHRSMHGQRRGLREPFVSGRGVLLMRPGDPSAPAEERINCRCSLGTRVRTTESP